MKKQTNLLGEAIEGIKTVWRHRKGYEIPAAILDTIDQLYPPEKPRPLPIRGGIKRTQDGWHMIFTLRPGTSFNTLKNQQEYLESATRSPVAIENVGGYAHLHIYNKTLDNYYPFEWQHSQYPKLYLPIPIGISQQGLEVLDLSAAPHLLIAGETGYGKSTMLLNLIHALLPVAKIAIIDPKRLQFNYLKKYVALAKKEEEWQRLLEALDREMERRLDLLDAAEVDKIQNYNAELPFIVLVIDEIAEVTDKKSIYHIDRIVRLARATGISVVAATQRPSKRVKVFEENVRDMFAARVCYLMPDGVSSRLVLGDTCSMAADIPAVPGRGVYKYGVKYKYVQTMSLDLTDAKKLLKKQLQEGQADVFTEWTNITPSARLLPR